jgi:uncharacterized protein (DUF885 family)
MRLAALLFLALAQLPAQKPDPAELDLSSSPMRPVIEGFFADRTNLQRTYGIESSNSRRARLAKFYASWTDRLAALPFDTMPQDGKVDYMLLRNYIDHERRRLDLDAAELSSIASFTPFSGTVIDLEEARRRMDPVDPEKAAQALSALARKVDETRRALEPQARAGQPPPDNQRRVLASRAAREVAALRNTLRTWFTFYDGYDPLFTWWASEPYKAADTALQTYQTFLRERLAGLRPAAQPETQRAGGPPSGRVSPTAGARAGESDDIIGNPIGREGLMNELAFEMIPYTPEELIAIAGRELAWCEEQMRAASRQMGFGDDWKKALEKVKTLHVDPGKQPELIRMLAAEAEKFLDDHDLVTVPALARETWRMEMMSPERQLVNPFFTGGEVISVSYPTAGMSYEQKMTTMRGNNVHFSRATVFHELIPGHHLQIYMGQRFRPYRSMAGNTPFITEGWALYWELLLWDLGFQKTPEDKVGALFWRMHRCARIIFSLSFHLGKMTPEECINFLVDRVGHERENAAGEVRRSFGGAYSPLYQAAYLLGGMQLYSLRKELVDSKKMTDRQFHDAVLRENRLPVELIRAALANRPLTRDYKTSWRAFGEPPSR